MEIIQKTFFAKSMDDYMKGIVAKNLDYWVGLENLANLTAIGRLEMNIELTSYAGINIESIAKSK